MWRQTPQIWIQSSIRSGECSSEASIPQHRPSWLKQHLAEEWHHFTVKNLGHHRPSSVIMVCLNVCVSVKMSAILSTNCRPNWWKLDCSRLGCITVSFGIYVLEAGVFKFNLLNFDQHPLLICEYIPSTHQCMHNQVDCGSAYNTTMGNLPPPDSEIIVCGLVE